MTNVMLASVTDYTALLCTVLGISTGAVSMLIYWIVSPQEQIARLKTQVAQSQSQLMRAESDDLHELWTLCKQSVGLSLKRLGVVVMPTLFALLPAVLCIWIADKRFDLSNQSFLTPGTTWQVPGYLVFWIPLCLSAAWVKLRFKIQ